MTDSTSPNSPPVITIDGSMMEGGGQILRISVCLASLLRKPLRVINIRGRRSSPGLKAQHKAGIELVHRMSPSSLSGCEIGSKEIIYDPQCSSSYGGEEYIFHADTHTAGSITLLTQISLPRALLLGRKCSLILGGGTDVSMAPTLAYFQHVFLPNLCRFQCPSPILSDVCKGYFPRGGGSIRLDFESPTTLPLKPINLKKRGDITSIRIIASVGGKVPLSVARESAISARQAIEQELKPLSSALVFTEDVYSESRSQGNGSSITIIASSETGCVFGGSALGGPKVKASAMGVTAAKDLLQSLLHCPKACVDTHASDQLIILMALAEGTSSLMVPYPLSLHTETAIKIAETLCGARFSTFHQPEESSLLLQCEGIAYKATATAQ
eukprot:TRINITY_DN550_c0_g1_i1.p1 TRINITY_DN550_c0_g1~~TRINITY_DN550_c0_g1_i1.p1  ORF type:complete len:384 (+),score=88.61 TRINITY_DN550_c0_g1_i1:1889-3040(+)